MKKIMLFLFLLISISYIYGWYYYDLCARFNELPEQNHNQYIRLQNESAYDFGNTFTIELWMNVASWTTAWQAIVTKGDNSWRLHRSASSSNIQFEVGDKYIISSGINFVGQWHHVAVVRNGTNLYMYIDSILNASLVSVISYSNNNYQVAIGENMQTTGRQFKGKLDEIRIWNTARSAGQINANRFNRLQGNETGLLSYFNLDSGSSNVYDAVGTTTATFVNYDTYVQYFAEQVYEDYGADKAWQFSAGGEKLQFDALFSYPNIEFTAEAWFNPSLISATDKTILYHGDNGEFKLVLNNSTVTGSIKLSDSNWYNLSWTGVQADQWYHVAYTVYTHGDHKLYINGILVNSATLGNGYVLWDPGTSILGSIGSLNCSSSYFKGKIDQVRIWNRALSESEIWANRHQDFTGSIDNLLANYQFNETINGVVFNRSGSINCATNEVGTKIASTWPKDGFYLGGTIGADINIPAGKAITAWANITIPTTRKLTINAGSTVTFLGHYGILAQGSLQALGAPGDSIRFTVADTTGFYNPIGGDIDSPGSWNGLALSTTAASDSTLLEHCIFEYGKASGAYLENSNEALKGGAIYIGNTDRYRISGCRLSENIAYLAGGAIYVSTRSTSSGKIEQSRLFANRVIGFTGDGGGAIATGNVPFKILDCRLTGNSSGIHGGAIYTRSLAVPHVKDCYIAYNTALGKGGGIAVKEYLYLDIHRNLICYNTAEEGGGVAVFIDGLPAYNRISLKNNIISYNNAVNGGGFAAINCGYYGNYVLNNTIYGNNASSYGGGIYHNHPTSQAMPIFNSILWGNTSAEGSQYYVNSNGSNVIVKNSVVQGGISGFGGSGASYISWNSSSVYNMYNLDLDPMLSLAGTDPYQPMANSPCINGGSNDYADLTNPDYAGNPRLFQAAPSGNTALDNIFSTVDIGAYEVQTDYGSLPRDLSLSGDMNLTHDISVPSGVKLSISAGSSLSFAQNRGLTVYGSLTAIGSVEDGRIDLSAIDPESGWAGLSFLGSISVGDSTYYVTAPADSSYLAYCNIRHGMASGRSTSDGGLVYVDYYNPLNISNCILSHGSAVQGSGIALINTEAEIYSSAIHACEAETGGTIYVKDSQPKLINLTIVDNATTSGPGAIKVQDSPQTRVVNCLIWGNGSSPVTAGIPVSFSLVEGAYPGITNLNIDPELADDPDRYILSGSSPMMNRGSSDLSSYPNLPTSDLAGNPRIHQHTTSIYTRVDIGAHEYPGLMVPANFSATDGNNNYPGYVYLNWNYKGYYSPNNGFQIFRDGTLLSTVYPQVYAYSDYSAIPGQKHEYNIVAYAGAEVSASLSDFGYVKPNGIITGTIKTPNDNPVAGVVVSLSPSSGTCLNLSGGKTFGVEAPDIDFGQPFTLEAWIKTSEASIAFLSKGDISFGIDAEGKLVFSDGTSQVVQDTSLVVNNDQWHHVAVVYDGTTASLFRDGTCVGSFPIALINDPSGNLEASLSGLIDDIRLWNLARTEEELANSRNVIIAWNATGLIGYWPMNEGSGTEIYDATNYAHIAITDGAWSSAEPGIALGSVTNVWGQYSITQIPYGSYATFTVTPSKAGHYFQPEIRLITLSQSTISANNVDFTDDSMIPISGRIMFQGTAVPVRGASVLLNGSTSQPPTLTDDEGYYVMDVEHGTVCTLSVSYYDQAFDRVWNLGAVTFPQANKHFYNVTRTEFVVEVLGGADRYPIGSFDVTLESVDNLYENTILAQAGQWAGGAVVIDNIPPLNYYVTVQPTQSFSDDPFNLLINQQFQDNKTQALDLRYPDTDPATVDTLSYIWRNELVVEVSWPDEYELKYRAEYPDASFYVVDQNVWIQVSIRAFEDYSTPLSPGRKTYQTNCDININDELGPLGESDTSLDGASFITYRFAPYLPSIIETGPRAFQKMLEITAYDPDLQRNAIQTDWAVIQGARPMESTYATTSPEVPFLILHDPPGDNSYSSFKTSSSHSTCVSFAVEKAETNAGNLTVHCGPDFVSNAGIMFSVQTEVNTTADFTFEIDSTEQNTNSYERKYTFTTSEEYKTSEDDQLIGSESDLFIGGALNLIWGLTKEVAWNDSTQSVEMINSVMVIPDGFATNYIYTKKQIELSVIPNLIAIGDTTSAIRWQEFLDMNQENIDNAVANPNQPANVSFNAGAGYTYEEENTVESSRTIEFETTVSIDLGAQIGCTVNGLGVEGGYKFNTTMTIGKSTQTEISTTSTMSYVLADDDETSSLNYQSDYFTVDVKKDPVYGTPVFNLLAGATSNRWEQNTMPRDGVDLSANTYTVAGLQEGEQAVFLLYLDNTSQTAEDRRYYLTLHHESNPGGAIVKINGMPLVERMPFDVPPGQRVQAVMTVEQGPYDYEYNDLTLEFYAPGDRGNDGPEGHYFYVYKSFDVTWEPPYSKVSFRYPFDNWIVNQADNDTLSVILTGYDLDKPDFESILFQYKHPYDSNWLTANEILRSELVGTNYFIVHWDLSQIYDGEYEIRAGTTDTIQQDYYCEPLRGYIDRSSPELLNPPQPADGILSFGDQISLCFSEFIDPNCIILPDAITLEITRTSTLVDVQITRYENTVYLIPNIANYWLENENLLARVSGLYDLRGNPLLGEIVWEFYVNANPVAWTQPKLELLKPLGQSQMVTAYLHNSGGQTSSFEITDLPDWITINTPNGWLLPLDTQTLVFTISDQLGYGTHRDTLYADIPALGREPLVFEVSVLADPPAWATTQLDSYDNSMTITGQLMIDGQLSTDTNDIIGAFVYDEIQGYQCRGVASLQSVPFLNDSYQFFLTVHSNAEDGEELLFRVWDSSTNKEHYGIQEEYLFISGAIYGTALTPVIIHVEPELFSSISCRDGWNWISVNLMNQDSMGVDDVLASLAPSSGDTVKNQTQYSQYVPESGWMGSLQTITTTGMVKLKLSAEDDLHLIGNLEDPLTTPIPYESGWNWIGYLPHVSISVNQAMAGLSNSATGDLLKSQTGYSQYIDGYGWYGSLLFMRPGMGYMLHSAGSGNLYYPDYQIPRDDPIDSYSNRMAQLRNPDGWQIDPRAYEYTACITCVVRENGNTLNDPNLVLAAFYGDECRGIAIPVLVQDQWTFFLTQYSNTLNQTLSYRLWDSQSDQIQLLDETLPFVNNQVLGQPLVPFVFNYSLAALEVPQNLSIQTSAEQLTLSWDIVTGAYSYKVLASDTPDGEFIDITQSGSFGRDEPLASGLNCSDAIRDRVSWSCELPVTPRRFYLVKASTDPR